MSYKKNMMHAPIDAVNGIKELLLLLQVQRSRYQNLIGRILRNDIDDFLPSVDELEVYICDAVELHAIAASLFDYARMEDEYHDQFKFSPVLMNAASNVFVDGLSDSLDSKVAQRHNIRTRERMLKSLARAHVEPSA